MELLDLSLVQLREASWNANQMDEVMRARLRRSIKRFDLVVPLVVRSLEDGSYETVGGAQRLTVLREMGVTRVPCVVVNADDSEARLLSQALNHIQGQDDLGLRAELLREVLTTVHQDEILSLLPETAVTLNAMISLGQEDMATYLEAWQKAQAARLKHLQFQLTAPQLEVVERALDQMLLHVSAGDDGNPNRRGLALYHLCLAFLERNSLP